MRLARRVRKSNLHSELCNRAKGKLCTEFKSLSSATASINAEQSPAICYKRYKRANRTRSQPRNTSTNDKPQTTNAPAGIKGDQ
jgi:hypothetical protein